MNGSYIPPPNPKPQYDPAEEAPKWNWYRIRFNLPVDKGPKPWPKVGEQPKSDDDPDWRGVVKNKIEKWPEPQEYKFGQPEPEEYFWFDTPDYADPFKKLGYAFKFFTMSGVVAIGLAGSVRGWQMTWPNVFQLVKEVGIPWLGAGMAASTAAITTANLRNETDDHWNYAIAGFVFGTILGHKNHVDFVRRVTVSVPAALVIKHNAETNGYLIPVGNSRSQTFGISGMGAYNGWRDGDFRFGFRTNQEEPGRDMRIPYA